jgi:hypothetical protein
MKPFADCVRIFETAQAASLAGELFEESFRTPFPVPRENAGLSIPTPQDRWHQYVAQYEWEDGRIETVGFCNWIRHERVYLEGGMCVKKGFYKRLPKEHWKECQSRGGIAQMIMEKAATELDDADAWFGYCGDRKALAADLRAGYELTPYKFIIVKWFRPLSGPERAALIDSIAKIGVF